MPKYYVIGIVQECMHDNLPSYKIHEHKGKQHSKNSKKKGRNLRLTWGIPHTIIIREQIQHKLNYFLFCQNFEKIFTTCAQILTITIKSNFKIFSNVRFEL